MIIAKLLTLVVCGGRDYRNKARVCEVLDDLLSDANCRLFIIQGGATGADALAADWAVENNQPYGEFPAEWEKHGKKAGALRNLEMLDAGPDMVVAFPGGKGTAHMVASARKRSVPVLEIPDTGPY